MIREVQPADLAALADVAQRSYAHAFGDTMSPQQLKDELGLYRSEAYFRAGLNRDTVLVYAEGRRILGFAQITGVNLPELTPLPGDQLLDRLYVDPDAQGQGIGRRLLTTALAHPRLAGAKRVFLQVRWQNQRALNLYRSAGFTVAGRTRLGVGELQEDDDYIMMRPVAVREPADVN